MNAQIKTIAAVIKQTNALSVALQMPDSMLDEAPEICEELQTMCEGTLVYVCADT
jgi:diphthamide biosynthesis enzyme Dph1/Dph2-like protein